MYVPYRTKFENRLLKVAETSFNWFLGAGLAWLLYCIEIGYQNLNPNAMTILSALQQISGIISLVSLSITVITMTSLILRPPSTDTLRAWANSTDDEGEE